MDIEAEWADEFWSLSGAVRWIYSKGGTIDWVDGSAHKAAEDLFKAIQSGRLQAFGAHEAERSETRNPIPAQEFLIAFPFETETSLELIFSEAPVLHWGAEFEADWRIGNGDTMENRHQCFWKRLSVRKADVLSLWPPGEVSSVYHTGSPGRPSAIQFVETEWRRRRDAGEALDILKQEASALHDWCRVNHRGITAPECGTIENRIRKEFQKWKARACHQLSQTMAAERWIAARKFRAVLS